MKFCTKCGAELPDQAVFCTSCGYKIQSSDDQADSTVKQYTADGTQSECDRTQQSSAQPQQQSRDNLGWYKFLIYFGLFAGAIWNLITGILYLTGAIYNTTDAPAELVYAVFPSLETVNIIFGIACMLLAAYGIIVRFMLAKCKKKSLLCLYLLYIIVIVLEIAYIIAVVQIMSRVVEVGVGDVLDAQTIASLIMQVVFLCISIVYFSKHKNIFVR